MFKNPKCSILDVNAFSSLHVTVCLLLSLCRAKILSDLISKCDSNVLSKWRTNKVKCICCFSQDHCFFFSLFSRRATPPIWVFTEKRSVTVPKCWIHTGVDVCRAGSLVCVSMLCVRDLLFLDICQTINADYICLHWIMHDACTSAVALSRTGSWAHIPHFALRTDVMC